MDGQEPPEVARQLPSAILHRIPCSIGLQDLLEETMVPRRISLNDHVISSALNRLRDLHLLLRGITTKASKQATSQRSADP